MLLKIQVVETCNRRVQHEVAADLTAPLFLHSGLETIHILVVSVGDGGLSGVVIERFSTWMPCTRARCDCAMMASSTSNACSSDGLVEAEVAMWLGSELSGVFVRNQESLGGDPVLEAVRPSVHHRRLDEVFVFG